MLQFISNGDEYTTRDRLQKKYPIAPTKPKVLLRTLELAKLLDSNKFHFLKREAAVEATQQISANA